MEFKKMPRTEHGKTKALYQEVFSEDGQPFTDYYYQWKAGRNEIYTAQESGRLCGMLHLNPYEIDWNGAIQSLHYIVAVATKQEYRHQGIMKNLLLMAMEEMQQRREAFTFLMPAAEAIYTPFGFRRSWDWAWEEQNETEKIEFRPITQVSEMDLQRLSDRVNTRLKESSSMFVLRSPGYYRELGHQQEASGGRLDILYQAGSPVCGICRAKEAFAPMMSRIICLETFIEQVTSKEPKHYLWNITDPLLPRNSGLYEIELSAAGGRLNKINPEAVSEHQTPVFVDISEIPQLLKEDNPFKRAMICEVV